MRAANVLRVVSPAVLAGDYPIALADWTPNPGGVFNCSAPLLFANANPESGCSKPEEGQSLSLPVGAKAVGSDAGGLLSIALVTRGVCPFIDKTRMMQKLGAAAVAVINTDDSVIAMPAGDKRTGDIVAPVVSIGREVRRPSRARPFERAFVPA